MYVPLFQPYQWSPPSSCLFLFCSLLVASTSQHHPFCFCWRVLLQAYSTPQQIIHGGTGRVQCAVCLQGWQLLAVAVGDGLPCPLPGTAQAHRLSPGVSTDHIRGMASATPGVWHQWGVSHSAFTAAVRTCSGFCCTSTAGATSQPTSSEAFAIHRKKHLVPQGVTHTRTLGHAAWYAVNRMADLE